MKTFLSTITFSYILLSLSVHGMDKKLEKLCDKFYLNESYNKIRSSSSQLKRELECLNNSKQKILQKINNPQPIANSKKIKKLQSELNDIHTYIEETEKKISEQKMIEKNLFDLRNYFKCPAFFISSFAFATLVVLATTIKDPQKALPATLVMLLAISPYLVADYMCDKY